MQILKKEIRSRIQQVATAEFLRYGYQEVTMRDIAKKSEISVGNLYNYYKNKEDLFDSLTSASYLYLNQLLKEVNEHGRESGVANIEFAKSLVLMISQLLKKHRVGFLLMIDRGQDTKYHNLKNEMITLLVRHFEKELMKKVKSDASLIMRIAAKNLVYGLIEVAKNYQGDEWADRNIERLIDYHLHGISHLYI
jgi:AcrR family transcriptional regulator